MNSQAETQSIYRFDNETELKIEACATDVFQLSRPKPPAPEVVPVYSPEATGAAGIMALS